MRSQISWVRFREGLHDPSQINELGRKWATNLPIRSLCFLLKVAHRIRVPVPQTKTGDLDSGFRRIGSRCYYHSQIAGGFGTTRLRADIGAVGAQDIVSFGLGTHEEARSRAALPGGKAKGSRDVEGQPASQGTAPVGCATRAGSGRNGKTNSPTMPSCSGQMKLPPRSWPTSTDGQPRGPTMLWGRNSSIITSKTER
jgi:hypothetical protein